MDKHQIRKAAKEYAKSIVAGHEEESCESDIIAVENSFADAFMAGIEWYINSVWHTPNEEPKRWSKVFVFSKLGSFSSWEWSPFTIAAFKKFDQIRRDRKSVV